MLAVTGADAIKTDMGLEELFALAVFAAQIDMSVLEQVVLEHPLVFSHRRADGAAVQLPKWDLINPVLLELFGPRSSR